MSLIKNSSIVIVGVFVSNLLAYVFHFVAGRMLGPEDYGVFGALMALFLLVALPAGAFGSAMTKFTSRYFANNEIGKIAVLRRKTQNNALIFSAVVLAVIVLLAPNIAAYLNVDSKRPVIIVGITLVFALVLPVNRGVLQGMKKFKTFSWNGIIEAGSRLLLMLALLYMGLGVNGAVLAYGLAYFVAFLAVFPSIKETKTEISSAEKIDFNPIYRYIFLVMVVNLMIQSILNLPSLFIKHYYSSEFTGYWTAALNIARISLFITGSISMAMFPEIAGEKDHKNKRKIYYRAAGLVFLASLGMALVFFVFPGFFIHILYGSTYDGSVPLLKWLGFAMVFMGLLQLWASYHLARIK